MKYELLIQHNKIIYYPPVAEGVEIEWNLRGQPGRINFEIAKTDSLEYEEGDPVRFSVDGKPFFYGFIFEKSRSGDNPKVIKITAYDQLYYLKNKDTYVYSNKTASALIKMIAEDFHLNLGSVENTVFPLSRTEDDVELFDVIQSALDLTMKSTGKMYCLYDKAGKLTLQSINNMKYALVIDEDTAGDFDYRTSISESTYNRIKLVYEDSEGGQRKVYIAQDGSKINKWGVLQYYEKIDNEASANQIAQALLSLYSNETQSLSLKNVLGDVNVRAGTQLIVILDLGDYKVSNYLLVNQVKHSFYDNEHTMELRLKNADIYSILKNYPVLSGDDSSKGNSVQSSSSGSSSSKNSQTSSPKSSYNTSEYWGWPLGSAVCYISSGFGYRSASISGNAFHGGTDITGAGILGKPVYATRSGKVITAISGNSGYGIYVSIDHGEGYSSLYGHMSERCVNAGDNVSKGQMIGRVGSTGNSTGAHLHFEIRVGGTKKNPMNYVKKP